MSATMDLPSLGLNAIRCACGRAPVLQSGRCWSCEPRPTARPMRALTDDVLDVLRSYGNLTAAEIAEEIGCSRGDAAAALSKLRRTGKATMIRRFGVTRGAAPSHWRAS